MADNILGFIATIDVTDLKAGLSQVKQAINKTKAEFDTATSSLENWQKCSKGVGAKLTQLKTILAAQEKAVETYQNEIKRVSKLEGDHSTQLEILKGKLEKAQNTLNKTKVQIEKYSKSYEELKEKEELENSENSKLLQSLDNNRNKLKLLESQYKSAIIQHGKYSTEAKNVASQIKKTTKEINNQEKKIKTLDDAYKKLIKSSESFKSLGNSLTSALNNIKSSLSSCYNFFINASETTQKLNDNSKRLETTYKSVGLSVDTLKRDYTELFSVIGDDDKVTEALSYLAQLGVSEEDLSKYTQDLIGIYAEFGNSMPINQLAQNINEAIKTGTVTGQLSNAIKQVGEDEERFKNHIANLSTEEERQQAILKILTKNYASLSSQYKENNQSSIEGNKTQLAYNETLKGFGDIGSELTKKLTELKQQGLEAIYPSVEKIFNFVEDHWEVLTKVATAIAGIIATIKGVTSIINLIGALSNPIGLVVATVTALAAIAITVYKNWDKVKNLLSNFWNSIKDSFENIKNTLSNVFSIDSIKEGWNNLLEFFRQIPSKISKIFSDAWEDIKKIWNNPSEFFNKVIDNIVKAFKEIPKKIKEIFINLINSIGEWCTQAWDKVKNFFTGKKIEISAEVNEISFNDNSLPDISKRVIVKPNFDFTNLDEFKEACLNYYEITEGTFDNISESVDGSIDLIQEKLAKIYPDKSTIESGLQDFIDSFTDIYDITDEKLVEIIKLYKYNTKAVGDYLKTEYKNREQIVETSLNNTENKEQEFLNEISQLNTEFDNSLSTVHTQEELDNLKKAYNEKLAEIKERIADYEKYNGEISDSVKNQVKDLEDTIQNADLSFEDKFKNTMSSVYSQMSKWGNKLSSLISSTTSVLNDFWQTQIDNLDNYYDEYCDKLDKEKEAYEEQLNTQNEEDEEDRAEELEANAELYKQGLIDEKEYYARKNSINEKYNKKQKQRETDLTNYTEQQAEQKAKTEEELLAKKNALAKKQFDAEKANDIAQVWIQAAVAIVKAFAELGPIGGAIYTAIITTLAGVQTAVIAQRQFTPYTELAEGGIVDKPTQALIGEDGKEAIIPLENNTGWINELADKLNTLINKDLDINNYQAVPSNATYYTGDTINNYNYEQTINSPSSLTRKQIYKDSKELLSLKKYGG